MDFCDQNAEKIAEQWYKALIVNPHTPSFRSVSRENCLRHAVFLYKNLKKMYFADDSFKEVVNTMEASGYAEEQYGRRIPLTEAVYALILIRRYIWLQAESSAIFSAPNEMYSALQSTNRILLLFDYAMTIVIQKYEKMRTL
jgi:hypothetical protein